MGKEVGSNKGTGKEGEVATGREGGAGHWKGKGAVKRMGSGGVVVAKKGARRGRGKSH